MVKIKIKSYLSTIYIRSAAFFSRQCWKLEQERSSESYKDDLLTEHQGLAIGAISASVSFLEANINKLFFDAADRVSTSPYTTEINKNTLLLMGCLWEFENFQRTAKVLAKYQHVLRLAEKPLFDEGKTPFQETSYLLDLRNALIHYKPEWIVAHTKGLDQKLVHELERKLRGKFNTNPFIKEGQVFFPNKCLSHGCAEWATKVVLISQKPSSQKWG